MFPSVETYGLGLARNETMLYLSYIIFLKKILSVKTMFLVNWWISIDMSTRGIIWNEFA